MNKDRILSFITDMLTAFVLFFLILSFSVTFTLNFRPLYYMDIELLKIESRSGIPKEEIKENYDELIRYNSMFTEEELRFPTLAMSETGKIHFEEVKVIFVMFQKMLLVTACLGLLLVLWQKKRDRARWLKYTGTVSVLVPVVLGAAVAMNWDKAFTLFHEIAFDNDFWIFDAATDPVITMLPDTFFLHCALMILGIIFLLSAACFLLYARRIKREKAQIKENE